MSENTGKSIQSVQRAIDILNCFNENITKLSLSELSTTLQLNKSTVHGIANTLKNNGYLWQSSSGKYMLGHNLINKYIFSDKSIRTLLAAHARNSLEFLANKYNSTTKLYYLNEGIPDYICHVSPSNSKYKLDSDFGNLPLYCSATGKLALSTMSMGQLESYLLMNPLKNISLYTITNKKVLLKELDVIRKNNYSKENQELLEGISAISAPIMLNKKYVAAISITSTSFHIDKDSESIILDLKEHANNVTLSLASV